LCECFGAPARRNAGIRMLTKPCRRNPVIGLKAQQHSFSMACRRRTPAYASSSRYSMPTICSGFLPVACGVRRGSGRYGLARQR